MSEEEKTPFTFYENETLQVAHLIKYILFLQAKASVFNSVCTRLTREGQESDDSFFARATEKTEEVMLSLDLDRKNRQDETPEG